MMLFEAVAIEGHAHQPGDRFFMFVYGVTERDESLGPAEPEEDGFAEAEAASVVIGMGVLSDIANERDKVPFLSPYVGLRRSGQSCCADIAYDHERFSFLSLFLELSDEFFRLLVSGEH